MTNMMPPLLIVFGHIKSLVTTQFLKDLGGNQYTAPHEHLRARGRNNETSVCLLIDVEAYNTARNHVDNISNA